MRVPLSLAWQLRFAAALVIVALALVALMTPQVAHPTPPAATPAAVVAPPPTVPLPTITPRPTQTPQTITSIIVRDYTPPPFPTATPPPSSGPRVSIVDFSYIPGVIRITAGQTVLWRNDGTEQHDVTGSDWHSGPLDPTYSYWLTFGVPGTYTYRCSIHLDMTGSVVVSS